MQTPLQDRVLALAGIIQAVALVDQLAREGATPEDKLEHSLASLFVFNPVSSEDVFGGAEYRERLGIGLAKLGELLDRQRAAPLYGPLVLYTMGLLHLENKLRQNKAMLDRIGNRLEQIEPQTHNTPLTDDFIISSISGIYQDTLSTLKYRIQVQGERRYLQNPSTAHRVRALLLAGIRAAALWRQVGGRRWQLLFSRNQMQRALQQIM
jgi:high frequency lysogenization protein